MAVWAAGTHAPVMLLARPTRGQVVVILSLALAVAAPRVRVASPPSTAAPQQTVGAGGTVDRVMSVPVRRRLVVSAIAGGEYHRQALKGDGTVWAWEE